MILQHSCDWNHWHGEFDLERPSSETQSMSVAIERWSVDHRAFAVRRFFSKTTILSLWFIVHFVGTSILIGTTVSLVAILYCCGWETAEKQRLPQNENVQEESLHLALLRTSNDCIRILSEVPPFAGMCWQQGTPPHRHYIQEVNIVIKMLWDKDNFRINSRKKKYTFHFIVT